MKYINRTFFKELRGILSCFFNRKGKDYYDLIIIRLDGIGDYVLWHDALDAYKRIYPKSRVAFICDISVRSLAEQEPFFTSVISFKRTDVNRSLIYLKKITAGKVINPMRERPWFADLCAMAISSWEKVAIEKKHGNSLFSGVYERVYSKLYKVGDVMSEIIADELFTKMAINNDYIYGLNPLCVDVEKPIINDDYVVVSFSTSTVLRNWPIDNFIKIINLISKKYVIVLTGAGKQDELGAQQIVDGVFYKNKIVNLVNQTSMPQVAAIISQSIFVIGNDSSAVHIAAAMRVPSIAITPGAHYGRFLPYPDSINFPYSPYVISAKMDCFNCDYNCIYKNVKPYECIRRVSVEMVCDVLQKLNFV